MATRRAFDVYCEPSERIRPAIIVYGTVGLTKAELLALALNFDFCFMLKSAALDAIPRYKRRPRLCGLLLIVANETVPTLEVDVQEQMAFATPLAHGPYDEKEPTTDLSGAWDNLAVPLVRLAWEQKLEGITAARTTNGAGEW